MKTKKTTLVLVGAACAIGAAGCLDLLGVEEPVRNPCAPNGCADGGGGAGATGAGGGNGGTGGTGGGTAGNGGAGGATVCVPGAKQDCYSGPAGTVDVGECKAGTETCKGDGSGWEACEGEVLPTTEDPAKVGDEGCDGYAPGEAVWSAIYGDADEQGVAAVAIDSTGSALYLGGSFRSQIALGQPLVCNTDSDGFLSRLDRAGTVIWSKQLSSSGYDTVSDVAVGPNGEVAAVVELDVASQIDGLPAPGDGVVLKLNDAGEVQWLTPCDSFLTQVVVDADGDFIVAGNFSGALDCGGIAVQANQQFFPYDTFVAKLAAVDGKAIWAKNFTSTGTQSFGELTVDGAGNIILVGQHYATIDFEVPGEPLSDPGSGNAFVAKLTGDGVGLWARTLGDASSQYAFGVCAMKTGNIAVTGRLEGTIVLPSGAKIVNTNEAGFVTMLTAGGMDTWNKSLDFPAGGVFAWPACGPGDELILGGAFGGTINLGGGVFTSSGMVDGFVGRFNAETGAHVWSKAFGGLGPSTSPALFAVAGDGSTLAGGIGNGSLDFGNDALLTAGADAFAALLAP